MINTRGAVLNILFRSLLLANAIICPTGEILGECQMVADPQQAVISQVNRTQIQ